MRQLKIIGVTVLCIIIGGIGFYLYKTDFGRINFLSHPPRQPKNEVPITYTLAWWIKQENLHVEDFKVEIIESSLNLFNSESLVSYTVHGKVKCENNLQLYVSSVHLSERINIDSLQNCDRIIEITPVLEAKQGGEDRTFNSFSFKNEHTIYSNRWGVNRIKFICGNHQQIIELFQAK